MMEVEEMLAVTITCNHEQNFTRYSLEVDACFARNIFQLSQQII